ncbi:MAG: hypothetical protein ACREVL_08940 [Solimonas sp.]
MSATLELDDLKQAWQALDRRLERQQALGLELLADRQRGRARALLWPLAVGQVWQLGWGIVLSLLFAPFWLRHLDHAHLAIYGLLLHGWGLLMIGFATTELWRLGRIDYAAPVLDIQRRLAELQAQRLRSGLWLSYAAAVMWVPLLLIGFYWLGADLWLHQRLFVLCAFVSSAVVGLIGVWVVLRLSRRIAGGRPAAAIERGWIGRRLLAARAALDEVDRFKRD